MRKLLLSTLIGIASLTTVGNAKADLKGEYNNIDYIHQTCKSNYKNKLKTAFWVDREPDNLFSYFQIYNDTVVYVGNIWHNHWNDLCDKDMIRSMGRLGKVYYYGYGAKYKYELVNNNEKLVKHVKEWEYLQYGKGGTFYLERCDQVSYCFK